MQSMWNDGTCDAQCNNRQCHHNDCTPQQVIDKCWTEQQLLPDDLTTKPTTDKPLAACDYGTTSTCETSPQLCGCPDTLPDVAALLKLDQVSLAIDDDLNQVIASWTVTYTVQWKDARLFSSPCALELDTLLSISTEEAVSEVDMKAKRERQKEFWMPLAVFDLAIENEQVLGTLNIEENQDPLFGVFDNCTSCLTCATANCTPPLHNFPSPSVSATSHALASPALVIAATPRSTTSR